MDLLIYDNTLKYVGMLDNYEYFKWVRKFRKVNEFELQINRYKNGANLLNINSFIVFKKGLEYRIGRIEFKELELTDEGKKSEVWIIKGRSMSSVLEDRICLENVSSGDGYDTITNKAETVMKYYVNKNIVSPTNTDRVVPNYIIANDLARGVTISASARFQPISEVLESVSLASGLGFKTSFDIANNQFIFDVIIGLDRTSLNGVNPVVMFSPDYDNIKSLTFRQSILGLKNVAIVGGQGEADLRALVEVGTEAGLNRKEFFVDARDLSTGLEQRGQERLAELGEEMIMEFEHTQNSPFQYLVDFDLGDIVTIIYPGISQMDSRIIEIKEEVSIELGDTFSITVGSEFPDLANVIQKDRKNINPEIRR